MTGPLVMSELLHLSLQKHGLRNAAKFANYEIVPAARENHCNLVSEMDWFCLNNPRKRSVCRAWDAIPHKTKHLLGYPEEYTGDSAEIAFREAKNKLAIAA